MQLCFEQRVELPRAALFAFHQNPAHLALLHQQGAAFRLLRHDGCLRPGSRVWFEITVAGAVPVVLGFEQDRYEPPDRFGEHLVHGPFRRFVHVHEFEEAGAATIVRDRLDVVLPWYYGGEIATRAVVAPLLRRAFGQRAAALSRLVQAGDL